VRTVGVVGVEADPLAARRQQQGATRRSVAAWFRKWGQGIPAWELGGVILDVVPVYAPSRSIGHFSLYTSYSRPGGLGGRGVGRGGRGVAARGGRAGGGAGYGSTNAREAAGGSQSA